VVIVLVIGPKVAGSDPAEGNVNKAGSPMS
jgi:hypothetical protein